MNTKLKTLLILMAWATLTTHAAIDRKALVTRNNPVITSVDTLASLSVGNGAFAFTTDITGLQTFPEYYRNGVPLGTQSEWGWHSFDNTDALRMEESYQKYDFGHGHRELYATEFNTKGRAQDAANYFRQNPHRLHLGCIGLEIDGLKPSDIKHPRQTLDMWNGEIQSKFRIKNLEFRINTVCHPERDLIASRIITKPQTSSQGHTLKERNLKPQTSILRPCAALSMSAAPNLTSTAPHRPSFKATIMSTSTPVWSR